MIHLFSLTKAPPGLKRLLYVTAMLLSLFGMPSSVYAETATGTDATPAPAASTTDTKASSTPVATATGPTSPPGDASKTYTLNPATGLWENDKYTWDPATKQTAPKTPADYSYNPATGMWDTSSWKYDAPSGKYVENTISQPQAPEATAAGILPAAGATTSDTSAKPKTQAENAFKLFFNAAISNKTSLSAVSGNAAVSQNTSGGSAASGDALALANLINLLQSSWDYASKGGLDTFMANMFGNVTGDITLNPTAASAAPLPAAGVTVNSSGSSAIANDILVGAKTGDATVAKNTQAGDATSGNAAAIANIINSINSSISAGRSFFGILNIFGNFNGDVLFSTPLGSLLSSGTATAGAQPPPASIQASSNQAITNTVNASASSGNALVAGNTSAGNATTGNSDSTVTILNLTGRQIIGKNALLVFVNVLGKWVGLIVDAPAGTRAAAIGNATDTAISLPTSVSSQETQSITNNLALSAASGDATVTKNTSAGNASSGNASTQANIVNIMNSSLSLTDWFGVLFINVFGNWQGSFGVNTEAGTIIIPPQEVPTNSVQPLSSSANTGSVTSGNTGPKLQQLFASAANFSQPGDNTAEVLAATTTDNSPSETIEPVSRSATVPQLSASLSRGPNLLSIIGAAVGLSMLAIERTVYYRNRQSSAK